MTYTYDGGLQRVKKSSGTLYWYCASCGKLLAESDTTGNIISEWTYFNGQRIARKQIGEGDAFRICDHDLLFTYR